MWVPTQDYLNACVANQVTAGSDSTHTLGSSSVGLGKAALAPTVNTKMSDISEANYTGYARKAAAFVATGIIGDGGITYVEGDSLKFLPSDTITPNTIYYEFLVGSDSATLLAVEVLDALVPLTGPHTQLTVVPRFGLDPNANYGLSLVAP